MEVARHALTLAETRQIVMRYLKGRAGAGLALAGVCVYLFEHKSFSRHFREAQNSLDWLFVACIGIFVHVSSDKFRPSMEEGENLHPACSRQCDAFGKRALHAVRETFWLQYQGDTRLPSGWLETGVSDC